MSSHCAVCPSPLSRLQVRKSGTTVSFEPPQAGAPTATVVQADIPACKVRACARAWASHESRPDLATALQRTRMPCHDALRSAAAHATV